MGLDSCTFNLTMALDLTAAESFQTACYDECIGRTWSLESNLVYVGLLQMGMAASARLFPAIMQKTASAASRWFPWLSSPQAQEIGKVWKTVSKEVAHEIGKIGTTLAIVGATNRYFQQEVNQANCEDLCASLDPSYLQ